MSTLSALALHTMAKSVSMDDDDEDGGDSSSSSSSSDDSSCEVDEQYCSSDDDEVSFVSYYSMDCLSVILEETDEDIFEEMSRRGSRRSRHSTNRGSSIDDCDDLPPSPPVRTRSQESKLPGLLDSAGTSSSSSSSSNTSPGVVQSPASVRSSGSRSKSARSNPDLRLPLDAGGGSLQTPLTDDNHNGEEEEDDDAFSTYSSPLNDVDQDFNVGGSPGRMECTFNKSSSKGVPMISLQTGEQIFASQSDDEYTFVSCTTGDDLSFASDLGSSHHNRTVFDMQGFEDLESSSSSSPLSDHQQNNALSAAGPSTKRRGSGISFDAGVDNLLPIPEDETSSQEEEQIISATISHQPLDYKRVQKKLDLQFAQNHLLSLSPNNKNNNQEDESEKSNRLVALKHRLRLERYGGVRSRKSFERSKKLLGRNFGNVKTRTTPPQARTLTDPMSNDGHDTTAQPLLQETLARFGGLTRRESFKTSKTEFQKKFDKQVKPLVFRRRRSLSPVRRQNPFDRSDFMTRMSKSDGHLLFNPDKDFLLVGGDDSENEKQAAADDLVLDPKFEEKFKKRQERFSGLRRRNSFNRSRRVLTKRFDRMQVRSKEEKERFGGLQRMNSYKQSRVLFEQAISLFEDESEHSERTTEEVNLASSGPTAAQQTGKASSRSGTSTKSKSRSAWSDNLTRSRLLAKKEPEESSSPLSKKLETSPDLRRARKHLQHAFNTQQQSPRQ